MTTEVGFRESVLKNLNEDTPIGTSRESHPVVHFSVSFLPHIGGWWGDTSLEVRGKPVLGDEGVKFPSSSASSFDSGMQTKVGEWGLDAESLPLLNRTSRVAAPPAPRDRG